ncbi:8-oxoguanine DNA glycosylase [Nitrospirillum viridazoti]|nr:endonuclease III domain-containing protein [Nitrospirillum amazonense]
MNNAYSLHENEAVMQHVIAKSDGVLCQLELPEPDQVLMPGVLWGRHEDLLSPAYWVAAGRVAGEVPKDGFRLGRTLAEELAACLLGGHGLPAEVGLAAYYRVRGWLQKTNDELISEAHLYGLLSEPLFVGGRPIRYRFARQRSSYLARSLEIISNFDENAYGDVAFRDYLCALPGIGLKTASWIVRNRRGSDAVAILDVHVIRACIIMGIFEGNADVSRHYRQLEKIFLEFCLRSRVRASVMDAVMWGQMRAISPQLLKIFIDQKCHFKDALSPASGEVKGCPETIAIEMTDRQVAHWVG